MNAIGGYFELADYEDQHVFPINGVMLNTARNALEYILLQLPDVKKLFIPYYTCEAVIEPLAKLSIPFEFYHINSSLEIDDDISLNEGDYIIVNNYFGLKDDYIESMSNKFADKLIVDNAQALFSPVFPTLKAIYSCRKFLGCADGGIAVGVSDSQSISLDYDESSLHNDHLFIRKEFGAEKGFRNYQSNESLLNNQSVLKMSLFTWDILNHIDYDKVIKKRRNNYLYLHNALQDINSLHLPTMESFKCPMVYPYYCDNVGLRQYLISNSIFVARYWPNVLEWVTPNDLEYSLTENIIPLPIDQRYGLEDMDKIIRVIKDGSNY